MRQCEREGDAEGETGYPGVMPQRMLTRGVVVGALVEGLPSASAPVLACWEADASVFAAGGALSDIDLTLVVEDDGVEDDVVEAAFARAEAVLEGLSPIRGRYRVPEPAWHGFSQRFYQLQAASPLLLVGLSIQRRSQVSLRLEPTRHGHARVYFDPEGLYPRASLLLGAVDAGVRAARVLVRARHALFSGFVEEELRHWRPLGALHFYERMTLATLIVLLRMRYAPTRFDAGMRDLSRDLPAPVHEELLSLAFVGDVVDLEYKNQEALRWTARLLEEDDIPETG